MINIITSTYEEWHHCITETCGIPLTKSYFEQRKATLAWFNKAFQEVSY